MAWNGHSKQQFVATWCLAAMLVAGVVLAWGGTRVMAQNATPENAAADAVQPPPLMMILPPATTQPTNADPTTTGTLTGKITANGKALPYALVLLNKTPTIAWCATYSWVGADSTGEYTFSGLPAGNYVLGVKPPSALSNKSYVTGEIYLNQPFTCGATPTPVKVTAGATTTINVDLTDPAGNVQGVVTSNTGAPVPSVLVMCSSTSASTPFVESGFTDTSGEYILGPLKPASDYICYAYYNGRYVYYKNVSSSSLATPIKVTGGKDTSNIDFIMETSGTPGKTPVVVLPCP